MQEVGADDPDTSTPIRIVPALPVDVRALKSAAPIVVEQHRQPPHETPEHALGDHVVTIQAGTAINVVGTLAGQPYQHRSVVGDCALVPANVETQERWDAVAEYVAIRIAPTGFQHLIAPEYDGHTVELYPHMLRHDPLLQQLGLTLLHELQADAHAASLYHDTLNSLLALHLARHYSTAVHSASPEARALAPAVFRRVASHITDHLQAQLSLSDLAAVAHLSPFHFARSFKQTVGVAPHQYVLQERIRYAQQLLQDQHLSILEVALQTGFSNSSHFARQFRRHVGISPTQFQHRKNGTNDRKIVLESVS